MKITHAIKQVKSGTSYSLMANRYAVSNVKVKRRKGESTSSYVKRWNESFKRLNDKALKQLSQYFKR